MNARTRTAVLASLFLAASAGAVQAQSYHPHYRGGGRVQMTLVDRDEGLELPLYAARGQLWAPGTPGHRYAVRLTNRTPARVLVVLSVDGVNAVSGQTAAGNQAGYVLEPFQTTEVAGWRKSMRDIAQFYFSDMRDSYATRTGRPYDVGVIGIAVFDEARRFVRPRIHAPVYDRPQAGAAEASAPEASAPDMAGSRAQELGTGHGRREYAPVARAGFIRASNAPVQVTEIRYDDARALAERGIGRHHGRGWRDDGPRAFPRGFVPDPPRGW